MPSPPTPDLVNLPHTDPESCPRKRGAGKPKTPEIAVSQTPRSQQDSCVAMAAELGDQYWEFNVGTIARMLSPKQLKPQWSTQDPYPPLSSFTCLVEDHAVQQALRTMPVPKAFELVAAERKNYYTLADFFNSCVRNCNAAYDNAQRKLSPGGPFMLKPRKDRWWPTLKFFSYDRDMKDRVDGAAPLKPNLVAGGSVTSRDCYWSMPSNRVDSGMEVLVAVEVCAMPLRLFSVVIGVNHIAHTLRFLIYHRGGLTASYEIDLYEAQGRQDVQRVIFSILLWQNSADAGLPIFTDGVHFKIPSIGTSSLVGVTTDKVLFLSLSVRGRGTLVLVRNTRAAQEKMKTNHHKNTTGPNLGKYSWPNSRKRRIEAEMYNTCDGQFGVPKHLVSFEACNPDGAALSDSIFLPPRSDNDTFASYRWYPLTAQLKLEPSPPDYRSLFVTYTADEGRTLEHCKSAWDLSECLLHALLGWLSFMNGGFLHRDVTIGNVVKPDKPVWRPAFSTRAFKLFEAYRHPIQAEDSETITQGLANKHLVRDSDGALTSSDDDFWIKLRAAVVEDEYLEKVVLAAERLEKALAKLGVSTECKALLIDGDTAAELKTYFSSSKHAGAISGTPEFMSDALRTVLTRDYVQNPVDDLHSFVWTALWATVYNRRTLEGAGDDDSKMDVQGWRKSLSGDGSERSKTLSDIAHPLIDVSGHAPLVKGMSPLFRKWKSSLETLEVRFIIAWRVPGALPRQKLYMFYRIALEGVADYAEMLYEQRERLQALQ
ncbi:hypothetical protein L227DRAFT_649286 [Lentinus tigrinus ALCF2SS1-6]|uniref:Fungal-type protein kinase domain-containing protein n=1 Tax=Lentinus tigrinus ALCF2SS1-6 TaxID=1328759 RepID=A0A5C2STH0_9APHY|nr:hypothetical protein L227DRAFT_649286 [Lentinus tigrinus ALCF2SS1-6]